MIVSIVQYLHKFSLLFLEHQFLSKYSILKRFLKFFRYLSIVKLVSIPFPVISFISSSNNLLASTFLGNCSSSFSSSLESSKTSCYFFSGSGSSRVTVSVSIASGLVILSRQLLHLCIS